MADDNPATASATEPGQQSIHWTDFDAQDARQWLSPPRPDDDKYSRGVLGMMTGSPSFPGAAVLGVEGASRAGVGMIRYIGAGRATRLVLQRRPEVVTAMGRVQAWLVGSGIDAGGREKAVTSAIAEALAGGDPAVIDAGALDLLGHATGVVVITPHAGELVTLLGAHGVEVSREEVAADPGRWAVRAAQMLGVTVLLKGHLTHVVGVRRVPPGGAAADSSVQVGPCLRVTAPTTELATAGSGDVLAGILGSVVATHRAELDADPTLLAQLAATAAVLHGLAGQRASGGGPLVALDIAEAVPAVIAQLRG